MTRSLELPESVYADLVQAAAATTPVGWIQQHLPKSSASDDGHEVSDEQLAAADASLDECLVSLGHAIGTDNEQIDLDLACEYGSDHADLYGPCADN
jgi:hypothetical protein